MATEGRAGARKAFRLSLMLSESLGASENRAAVLSDSLVKVVDAGINLLESNAALNRS